MSVLWLIIVAVAECSCSTMSQRDNVSYDIQDLADAIATRHFSASRCITVISERSSLYLRTSQLPMFYITLDRTNNDTLDSLLLTTIDAGCLAYVLQTHDVMWMVQKFSELFRSPRSHYRANRRYVYLPINVGNEMNSVMNDVFSCKSMNWMPDLLIVNLTTGKEALDKLSSIKQKLQVDNKRRTYPPGDSREISYILEIFTHKFVSDDSSEKVFLDAWAPGQGFVLGVDLFPDKVHNLMGKQLRMMSIPYAPFTVILLDKEPPVYDGLEFQAMFEFGKKHNITWDVVYDLEDWWGEIWDNGSGNGLLGAMAEDKVDFSFCAFYLWYKEFSYIDYSVTYYRSGLTAVAPKPKTLPAWLIPVRPFNSYMWYAVLASVVIITVVLYVISKSSQTLLGGDISSRYSTLVECGFRTAGLLVLQVPDDERDFATPRYVPLRHLVTWLILFYLVVSSAYGGGLSFILTVPQFHPPIETPKDLADSGLTWTGVDEVYIAFLKSSSDPVMKTLTRNFVVHPEEELVRLAFEDIALIVERLQGGHFADVKYLFEEMMQGKRLMKEDVVFGLCVLGFRKGSPYQENMNALLYKLRESGILLYWEGMTVRKFLSQRQQLSVSESRTPPEVGQTQLSFSHVQGAFYLLLLGLLLAFIVFGLEILRFQYMQKKKEPMNNS